MPEHYTNKSKNNEGILTEEEALPQDAQVLDRVSYPLSSLRCTEQMQHRVEGLVADVGY